LFVVVRGAAELPRRHRSHDRREHPDGDHRPQQASAAEARAGAREPLRHEQRLVVVRVAVVVLGDVEVSVEAEVVRVRAEEALHIRVAGQDLPAFLLQGLEVAVANADRLLDVGGRESSLQAGLAQAPTDLEHAAFSRMLHAAANIPADGPSRARTGDLRAASATLSQLSYGPVGRA